MRKGFINCVLHNHQEQGMLVDEGKIIKLGSNEEITKLVGSDELIDVRGMFVSPGFVDSHMHLAELGSYLSQIQCMGDSSLEVLRRHIENYRDTHKEETWLIGRGWDQNLIGETPTKSFLDQISTTLPICLTRVDGHVMVVNSKALQLAGIEEDTTIDGGNIRYEEGLLEENAMQLMQKVIPSPSEEQLQQYIEKGMKYANANGVTTVGSDDFFMKPEDYRPVLNVFEQMSYQQTLTVRVTEQCEFSSPKEYASFLDDGYTMDVGNDFFRIGPLKLISDGTLGARTAALLEPYTDDPSTSGIQSLEEDDIRLYRELADRFNMGVIIHAIGDGAVETGLNVLMESMIPGNPLHSGLVHCQIMTQKQIDTVIENQISCYIQTPFLEDDLPLLQQRVGSERAKTCYPFKTLLEGTLTSNGSDAPVCMPKPFHGIALAVNGVEGYTQTVNVEEAFNSYTINGAKQLFMEDRIGKIEEGYYADFVVCDQNIFTCNKEDIAQTKVMMTVMNGEVVFEK